MDFFTADQHFGHFGIVAYTKRPFVSAEEMDDEMVLRWNEVVSPTDTVYQLGDFTLGGYETFLSYVQRLNGNLKIVPGSHDRRWLSSYQHTPRVQILPPLYTVEYPGDLPKIYVLCHYAMRVWDRSHYGSFHLYGHSHGMLPGTHNSVDVGVDKQNFYPVSREELDTYFSLYGGI